MKEGQLRLHFRPNDTFCKPLIGNVADNRFGLLLRVRRRKRAALPGHGQASHYDANDLNEDYAYQVTALGQVTSHVSFNGENRISLHLMILGNVFPK